MQHAQTTHRKLYVGMHDGVCVVTSTDAGQTWHQGQVTPLAHAVARFAVSPTGPQRAYCAAYEAGVYRSDDGGQTWQPLPAYPADYAHSVLVHPQQAQTVYVGSEPAAIFCSHDGGETWEECAGFRAVPEYPQWWFHAETRGSHVRDLRMARHDPRCLYAGIEVGGVVRSDDGGVSWQQLPGTHDDIHCIDPCVTRPQTVYVATARGPYRSDDAGAHWELINHGLQRSYTLHIAAAPDDADLVLVTVSKNAGRQQPQLYRSTTGGRSWQPITSIGADEDMVVAIDWDPTDPQRVYAGTDKGRLWCSHDRGASWLPVPVRLPTVAVGALVVAPT
ncbi:hypothetical protein NKDENANG_00582 [Candidatus Entotheonellaceae bacterium PAL068K]